MRNIYLLLVLCLISCGTVFSGTTQKVTFDSNVKNVVVFIDGIEVCTAPCSTEIDRSSDAIQIVVKKEGYKDKAITLRSCVNRKSYFNISWLPSWSTDAISGGVWEYKNNALYFNMEREKVDHSKLSQLKKESDIRQFVLFTFDDLRAESYSNNVGEYIESLAGLTSLDSNTLIEEVKKSNNEVACVDNIITKYQNN